MARSKILKVPYLPQPTAITCQSTVLKMFAEYLEANVVKQTTGGGDRAVQDIWKDINTGNQRPSKYRNAHVNMKWWLEQHFPTLQFRYQSTELPWEATDWIVDFVDHEYPVLVAVSHARVEGHIILVVGYENYEPNMCSEDFRLVVHDPYGKFDPTLLSNLYGKNRTVGGFCKVGGGEWGPGAENRVPLTSASRNRVGDKSIGTFYLLSVAS